MGVSYELICKNLQKFLKSAKITKFQKNPKVHIRITISNEIQYRLRRK